MSPPTPPFPLQSQALPAMNPPPDYDESSYHGSGRLHGKKTLITGGDSGIGRGGLGPLHATDADMLNPSGLCHHQGRHPEFHGRPRATARGTGANTVAPSPVWTPLIPASLPPEKVQHFGEQVR